MDRNWYRVQMKKMSTVDSSYNLNDVPNLARQGSELQFQDGLERQDSDFLA